MTSYCLLDNAAVHMVQETRQRPITAMHAKEVARGAL
jgi:hypothetical protein